MAAKTVAIRITPHVNAKNGRTGVLMCIIPTIQSDENMAMVATITMPVAISPQ
jgi:hypothetical protein